MALGSRERHELLSGPLKLMSVDTQLSSMHHFQLDIWGVGGGGRDVRCVQTPTPGDLCLAWDTEAQTAHA